MDGYDFDMEELDRDNDQAGSEDSDESFVRPKLYGDDRDKYWADKVTNFNKHEEAFLQATDSDTGTTEPFLGFDPEKEKTLLDQIEYESGMLYDLILELEDDEVIRMVAALTAANKGGPVPIPSKYFNGQTEGTPKIKIVRAPGQEKTMQDIVADLNKPLSAGWKRELIYKCVSDTKADVVQYLSPDGTELKTVQEIIDYLENIYGVSDSSGGLGPNNFSFHKSPLTSLGYDCGEFIYVVDSTGRKRLVNVRRRKPSVKAATEEPPPELFANGDEPPPLIQPSRMRQSVQREGMFRQPGLAKLSRGLPPNAAIQQFKSNTSNRTENSVPGMMRRQRPERSTLGGPAMNRHSDDGMFAMSSYNQNNSMGASGMEERRGQLRRDRKLFDGQNQFNNNNMDIDMDMDMDMEDDEVLPCSIRCPGMTGKVPNLQCKSCLCLYHGACLGFPPNAKFANFICPNCDATQNAELGAPQSKPSMSRTLPTHMLRQRPMGKGPNQEGMNTMMSRRIGQTVISPEFQPIGKGGMSVKRMEIKPPELPGTRSRMAGIPPRNNSLPSGKGMWPTGKIPLPPLSSSGKNVVLRPMGKIPKGRAPPLPTLHPMLPNNSNSLAPPPIPGRANFNLRGMPKLVLATGNSRSVVPLPDLSRKRTASPQASSSNSTMHRGAVVTTQDKRNMTKQWAASAEQFHRYPQTLVLIGNKKYIAIARGRTEMAADQVDSNETDTKQIDNGHAHDDDKQISPEDEAFVLGKIFPYLSVRDLLSASCVNTGWNKAASNVDLWKTIRMKNAHIFDFESFLNLLNQRKTEVLDLRKMAYESEMNWNALIDSLTKIPNLKKVILGPSRNSPESLTEMITARCSTIEVVTQ